MKLTMPWTATNGHTNGAADKLDDVRKAIGNEVDHLAQVAAQMGREAGAQADTAARDVARDAQKQTGVAMSRLADLAATLGPTIAVMGRQKMRGLGQQAQTLGSELRQVRITTEPRRSGSGVLPGIALIGGLGIGVGAGMALMYLLDPQRGKLRRRRLMARLTEMTRAGREAAAQKANAFADRTVGVMSGVRDSVTTGIGVNEIPIRDEGLIVDEATSVEVWPEGTRVPTV
jgi:gas vesicle protein